ncbi:MAG: hypothetical protein ACJAVV_003307 [Alphaproteobacteria bacterium]|jgi:hypothetical protein
MSKQTTLYRVEFNSGGERYELYVKELMSSSIFGFIEIAGFVWDTHTELVLDPSHERLKDEFASVDRTFIPMHNVLRIDQVKEQGSAKIRPFSDKLGKDKVTAIHSPIYTPRK